MRAKRISTLFARGGSIRRLALALTLAVVVATPAAAAAAVPFLGLGEAARQIGRSLHGEYNNIDAGSLDATCRGLARNRVRCYFEYGDEAGNWYCGRGTVRETWQSYFTSWRDWRCSL
jgi:hypothetical protein